MIPLFPKFKFLELEDAEQINAIVTKYPPYSDYNFVSLWSYNVENKVEVSVHDNNLLIKFLDYTSSDYFYSCIGTQ
ncbi:MAG: hypothetical protein NUV98_00565, partial [Candidatus Roizmanbacteria bacterium]|nr:hypothetical protein [Candidatus Roizmanbacteria bacterium]